MAFGIEIEKSLNWCVRTNSDDLPEFITKYKFTGREQKFTKPRNKGADGTKSEFFNGGLFRSNSRVLLREACG